MDSWRSTPNFAAFAKSTFNKYIGKFGLKPEDTPSNRGSAFSRSTNSLATVAKSSNEPAVLS